MKAKLLQLEATHTSSQRDTQPQSHTGVGSHVGLIANVNHGLYKAGWRCV